MNIVVPYDRLRPDTLEALIEEFVTRDGAVQGHTDTPLHDRIESVRDQLVSGKAVIVFDEKARSCTISLADRWRESQEREDRADHQDGAAGA